MKMDHSWIRELGLVTVVSSLVLLMFPSGSMAAVGDWDIYHNTENVPVGEECSIIATDGVNHVEGTFEWGYGLSFNYSYDSSTWYDVAPPPSWSSGVYTFDFYTDWDLDYGQYFIIQPSTGPWYYCSLP
jgi:hypothetical protein